MSQMKQNGNSFKKPTNLRNSTLTVNKCTGAKQIPSVKMSEYNDGCQNGSQTLNEKKKTATTKQYIITHPCINSYPFAPHFYIVKLGFTGVYIIFLFLLKNIDSGYSLELPH